MLEKPILFLIFNRKDTTQKVFEQIRLAKPKRLYLASDGARNAEEAGLVCDIRNWILENVDWECEIKTLFREENLGCGVAVSSAISWFFTQEEDGIILEDDCVPNQSFFSFCSELLDYYKGNKRIWHIAGDNPLGKLNCSASYCFTKIQLCWGWATWADRWSEYEFDLANYDTKNIEKFSNKRRVQKYWTNILSKMLNKEIDTWDYQWAFKIVEQEGFCILPSVNLVSNIGINGTHFDEAYQDPRLKLPTYEIEKIVHPKKVEFDKKAVALIYEKVFGIKKYNIKGFLRRIKRTLIGE